MRTAAGGSPAPASRPSGRPHDTVPDRVPAGTGMTAQTGVDAPLAGAPRRTLTLVLLLLVFAVHYVDRQVLAVLMPAIKAEYGVSDTTLGLLSGFAFTVLFSASGLVVARVADRVDRARVITWSLATFTVATAMCGFVSGFWQLVAMRLLIGIGEGGTNPASHALIAELYPTQWRATAMATYSVGPYIGLFLAFGAGAALAQAYGWRTAYVVVGGLGILLVVATAALLRDPRASVGPRPASPPVSAPEVVRAMWASPALRHLLIAATLATVAAQGVVTWLPTWLTREHEMEIGRAGLFLAVVFGIGGAAATVGFGRLLDAAAAQAPARKPRLTAWCMAAVSLLWLPALLVDGAPLALAALVLPASGVGVYVGATFAMVQDRVDARARAFSAAVLLVVTNLVGAGLGPLLIGLASDALGSRTPGHALTRALLLVPVFLLWSAWHYACAARAAPD